MAVDAVLSKPFSCQDSLLSGINAESAPDTSPSIIMNSGDLSPFFYIGARLSRELKFNYQGIVIVCLGKFRQISEPVSLKS
jgi:hypothetical protein